MKKEKPEKRIEKKTRNKTGAEDAIHNDCLSFPFHRISSVFILFEQREENVFMSSIMQIGKTCL